MLDAMPLSVTVLEVPARFDAIDRQLEWIDAQLATHPVGDVVVLPEACLTGYVAPGELDFDLSRFAEPFEGRQLELLRALAGRARATVIGPVIERDRLWCYNAAAIVSPDGTVLARYRKRHPWMPETWASPSANPLPRFTVGDHRCSLAICFDVHFLSAECAEVLEQTDVLFFQSAWVDDRDDSRPRYLTPLAQQFELTIVNANWGRGAPAIFGQGRSLVMGPDGAVRARLEDGSGRLDVVLD